LSLSSDAGGRLPSGESVAVDSELGVVASGALVVTGVCSLLLSGEVVRLLSVGFVCVCLDTSDEVSPSSLISSVALVVTDVELSPYTPSLVIVLLADIVSSLTGM